MCDVEQEAREVIEKAGVVVFKDASANKGGVTSSSLEVLAALVLTDAEFHAHMAVSKEACAHGRPDEKDVREPCRVVPCCAVLCRVVP